MKRKIVSLLLLAFLVVGMTTCGKKASEDAAATDSTTIEPAPADTTAVEIDGGDDTDDSVSDTIASPGDTDDNPN